MNAHAYFDYEVICTGLLRLIFPMIRKKGKFVLSNPVLHRILWRKSQSLDFFCVILRELQKNFMDALYVIQAPIIPKPKAKSGNMLYGIVILQ